MQKRTCSSGGHKTRHKFHKNKERLRITTFQNLFLLPPMSAYLSFSHLAENKYKVVEKLFKKYFVVCVHIGLAKISKKTNATTLFWLFFPIFNYTILEPTHTKNEFLKIQKARPPIIIISILIKNYQKHWILSVNL